MYKKADKSEKKKRQHVLKSTFFLVISQCILNQVAFYPFGWDYLFNLSRGNEIRNYVLIAYKQSVNIYTSNCTLLFYQIRKSLLLWLCWHWASETMRLYSMRAENETQSFQQGLSRIQHYIHDLDWNIELRWISLLKYITQIFNVLRGGGGKWKILFISARSSIYQEFHIIKRQKATWLRCVFGQNRSWWNIYGTDCCRNTEILSHKRS